jgi:hypothetical protein
MARSQVVGNVGTFFAAIAGRYDAAIKAPVCSRSLQ